MDEPQYLPEGVYFYAPAVGDLLELRLDPGVSERFREWSAEHAVELVGGETEYGEIEYVEADAALAMDNLVVASTVDRLRDAGVASVECVVVRVEEPYLVVDLDTDESYVLVDDLSQIAVRCEALHDPLAEGDVIHLPGAMLDLGEFDPDYYRLRIVVEP